jgi:hypothetical protein
MNFDVTIHYVHLQSFDGACYTFDDKDLLADGF